MTLCFATNNTHKLEEVGPLLGDRFVLRTLDDIGCIDELPETGDTLDANALQKARYVWEHFGIPCFADDTGLEVTALNGAPGVYSARYAGPERSATANVQKLLDELAPYSDRTAQFRTVIAFISADGRESLFEGTVKGTIVAERRGDGGFGYDPIFLPDGQAETFAQLPLAVKNQMGHRGRAVTALVEWLTAQR